MLDKVYVHYISYFQFVLFHFHFAFRIIGMYGVGPKYLVDEYAILDSRYWVLQSPDVMAICVMEFYIMTPLCYMWYVCPR